MDFVSGLCDKELSLSSGKRENFILCGEEENFGTGHRKCIGSGFVSNLRIKRKFQLEERKPCDFVSIAV